MYLRSQVLSRVLSNNDNFLMDVVSIIDMNATRPIYYSYN